MKRIHFVYRTFLWIIFALYCYMVLHLLLFGREVNTDISPWEHITATTNFIPFQTISRQIRAFLAGEDRWFFLRNLGGNFFLLFPVGFLFPCLFPKASRLWKCLLGMTVFIVIVELLQGLLCIGFMDIDDLIFNVIGGACGYALMQLLLIFIRRHEKKRASHGTGG